MEQNITRQQMILEIIEKHIITSQEQLQAELEKEGCVVTQATISRDIKKLRLLKNMTSDGSYQYSYNKNAESEARVQLESFFPQTVKEVDYAGYTVVIKCYSGMANAVCAALDNGSYWQEEVVGTIAGDDTIFALLRSEPLAERCAEHLKELL